MYTSCALFESLGLKWEKKWTSIWSPTVGRIFALLSFIENFALLELQHTMNYNNQELSKKKKRNHTFRPKYKLSMITNACCLMLESDFSYRLCLFSQRFIVLQGVGLGICIRGCNFTSMLLFSSFYKLFNCSFQDNNRSTTKQV